jgi:Homeodomain-like domain
MLAALRRTRYGYLLALHILLWCTAGRNPMDIAAVLFCSRSSVYRTVRAYQTGTSGLEYAPRGRLIPPICPPVLSPTLRRSLFALLKTPPRRRVDPRHSPPQVKRVSHLRGLVRGR